MSDYRVRWTNGSDTVEVDLIDAIGPLNEYKFSDPNAIVPPEGKFTNQTTEVIPLEGGWIMYGFDNSQDYSTDGSITGNGEVKNTHIGTFPEGDFVWVVIPSL